MRNIVLLLLVSILSACTSTFTEPATGTKYNVDVGCTDDMQQYRAEREELIDDKKSQDVRRDCFTQEKEKTE